MIFYTVEWRKSLPQNAEYPCCRVEIDHWDDYGAKTLFRLTYFRSQFDSTRIGGMKILKKGESHTVLPETFNELPEDFCSLGTNIDFYAHIKDLFDENFSEVLSPLNDLVSNPGILDNFENDPNFKTSLLRFSESEKAFKDGLKILTNAPLNNQFDFTFITRVRKAKEAHTVNINFKKTNDFLPNRIYAFVGKNGSGKTQVLANLATAISGLDKSGTFKNTRPLFNRVIALSYSAFDRFERPERKRTFSYYYCGLMGKDKLLSPKGQISKIKNACEAIEMLNRKEDWYRILKEIIDEEILIRYFDNFFTDKEYTLFTSKSNNLLSSGQSIILYLFTEVLANIRQESLLLMDEPEMHLHPNAIGGLVKMINNLLEKFDSYAIVATHSPILLQQIPSRYISVFNRYGDVPSITNLNFECFGEELSEISDKVFLLRDNEENYKVVLKNTSQQVKTYREASKLFEKGLGLNARVFLRGLYD